LLIRDFISAAPFLPLVCTDPGAVKFHLWFKGWQSMVGDKQLMVKIVFINSRHNDLSVKIVSAAADCSGVWTKKGICLHSIQLVFILNGFEDISI
jgi:hypothetical protein